MRYLRNLYKGEGVGIDMEKTYKTPNIEIWTYENDVVTLSTNWQENYDDKGTWKDTWVTVED